MVKALFDTNILIENLRRSHAADEELRRFETKAISLITWMEVLGGTPSQHSAAAHVFLDGFNIIEIAADYVVLTFDYKGWGDSGVPKFRLAPYGRVTDSQYREHLPAPA